MFDNQFNQYLKKDAPLADRIRPETLDDFFGQEEIISEGKLLRRAIEKDELFSMLFWGPPGSGKTTLAKIVAKLTKSNFESISATSSGKADLKRVISEAEDKRKMRNERTILFIDEIHRWNKAQQDALLPFVENGIIILIGATTENPSFEVNSALLSRCRVFVIKPLSPENLKLIIKRAMSDKEKGFGYLDIQVTEKTLDFLAIMSNGDARTALNALEIAIKASRKGEQKMVQLDQEIITEALQKTNLIYDRAGEEHYNIISALHKSMRGSDPDASLYWMARMLEAGEDPLFIARRLIRFASEDIGLADPEALVQASSAFTACHYIGVPECNVILAQAVVYLAKATKSNSLYIAYGKVKKDIEERGNDPVPLHLRNAPTELMKNIGYGAGYKYNPDFNKPVEQEYMPEGLEGRKYLE
ncbi:AAA family ATPase [Candidatus Falkowbacteria bacterium RIFOXYB2_FULL_38_15]|uniref:Replication-associated recombination protein A n=1 Tax=Candidatus Falkowbacteria bacterium RIFOXYA2_FULL_38_12 TaxID=1797993 RepID=A0A1F5S2E0_9BACT|nr:MAG: AAA family ATPase [Candidatus Falkowbacteria bacterium RIFOXYA2_FULL_38_12]OGF32954.1 MAG: AAA family ATPase [Candidatus Falkowbacteria bacterium RIFOXYB2_FULL_38_15]OGF44164.1 MAG: AAA family ATPase [Candidatus Falkowbacteria bacterium RIFOXYD2_FULL_39_16]